jgi:hypothetical protein
LSLTLSHIARHTSRTEGVAGLASGTGAGEALGPGASLGGGAATVSVATLGSLAGSGAVSLGVAGDGVEAGPHAASHKPPISAARCIMRGTLPQGSASAKFGTEAAPSFAEVNHDQPLENSVERLWAGVLRMMGDRLTRLRRQDRHP